MDEVFCDLKQARRKFSRIGLALCAILVITTVIQLLWFGLFQNNLPPEHWLRASSWGLWLGTFIPQYVVAIPIALLILRGIPAEKPEDHKLSKKEFLMLIPMGYCVMYAGNLIGTLLSMILSGGNAQNAVLEYAMDNNPLKILFTVILAPLLEEYVCRKQIIDRTKQYGEKTAVFLSAMVFGLLHQNLFQFFYAFGMGLIFGYIYIRTGRLRYTVLLHSIYNFIGSVIGPWILKIANLDAMSAIDPTAAPEELLETLGQLLPGFLVYMLYSQILMGLVVAGLVFLILSRKKLLWKEAPDTLAGKRAFTTVYCNVGMIFYVLLCLAGFVLALL